MLVSDGKVDVIAVLVAAAVNKNNLDWIFRCGAHTAQSTWFVCLFRITVFQFLFLSFVVASLENSCWLCGPGFHWILLSRQKRWIVVRVTALRQYIRPRHTTTVCVCVCVRYGLAQWWATDDCTNMHMAHETRRMQNMRANFMIQHTAANLPKRRGCSFSGCRFRLSSARAPRQTRYINSFIASIYTTEVDAERHRQHYRAQIRHYGRANNT